MSHSYVQNNIHLVFSTKERRKTISQQMQMRLWKYVAAVGRQNGILIHQVGGMEDHIHILLQLPAVLSLAKAVLVLKAYPSKWMGKKFAWQKGYAAFSVSASNVPAVRKYIQNQQHHHRKMGFDQEIVALLEKHGVEYDPKYLYG
ncbi:MAG TPA: IS200/IS605 family transposase [Terriglobales bacterium]|nr:IS200/IS605 family transposase [Terriglobales bacterium]